MRKKRVLIIDDNTDLQEIYRIYFEEAGFLVNISSDGMKGITDILKFSPDIILLDIMMPNMNGYEVLETLKKHSSIRTPIAVCSNLTQPKDIKRAYELGADLFIKKSENSGKEVVEKALVLIK